MAQLQSSHQVAAPSASSSLGSTLRADVVSGALVSLIALPLSLGIAMASGFPPIAGVLTAIVGGLFGTLISNSALTIKGPAAGLIVIVLGAVQELGQGDPARGYKLTLGVGVVAGLVQIALGLLRTGVLGEIFPMAAVHGMLAAIGIIIIGKQAHTLMGVVPQSQTPLLLIAEIPHSIGQLNPEVALIGAIALLILFGLPKLPFGAAKRIPAPMLVVLTAIPLGMLFDLSHEHMYTFMHHHYVVSSAYLVRLPGHLLSALTAPSFAAVSTPAGIKYIIMLALVGSLESLLSAKAIDQLDPQRRRTDLNRDLVAVGVGNVVSSMIGGLPMISEIVRSSANLNNGARSRLANLMHGLFLLACVALLPALLQRIPLAALGAMLVYTGLRLASPKEFIETYHVGREQLAVFVVTIITTLATDLLVGVAAGVGMKLALHLLHGVPVRLLLRSHLSVARTTPVESVASVDGAAVFSNWLSLRKQILALSTPPAIRLDLSHVILVDHTVLSKLDQLKEDLSQRGQTLAVEGLDQLHPLSEHPQAARKLVTAKT
jgi:MFS superfamily sulfate permease-like transporter